MKKKLLSKFLEENVFGVGVDAMLASRSVAEKQFDKKSAPNKHVMPLVYLMGGLLATTAVYADDASVKAQAKKTTQAQNKELEANGDTLPEVSVSGEVEKVRTGYQATKTRVGKTLQDPQDIPQAITTVTNDLMHDQQVSTLKDALRNVSGLTFNAGEGGRTGDNFMLRGFYTFGDIYLDGIRDTAQYFRETFNIEQVDVLRGSAAMLFGRGQAGGVINQVTKVAELEDEGVVTASAGSYQYGQVTADLNKQLGETSAIRINLMHRDEETFRKNPANGDRPEFHRDGIAVSLGYGIGTDDEFYFNHLYTSAHDVPDFGVRFSNGRPQEQFASTFWGTGATFDDSQVNISTGTYTHKFSKDTELRTQLRHADYQRAYWTKTPSATDLPNAAASTGSNVAYKLSYTTDTLQSNLNTKFDWLGMKHELLTGIEYLKEDSYRQTLANVGTVNAPSYNDDAVTGVAATFQADNYALLAQDTVEFMPHWKVTLGARRDELRADYVNTGMAHLSYGEWSTRAGLSWQPTEASHYYLSYSDSFSPTADLYQLTTTPYPAERSETAELGSKWLFWDGDLSLRTALYRADKDWERNTDFAFTSGRPILTKKRRTDGLELEVAGRINSHWDVFGGIALMDATILEVADGADARFAGQRARNTPPVTLNLWTTYKLSEHWKVGGGLEAKGERYAYVPSQATGPFTNGGFTPNTAPGYMRVDAMVAYEEKKWAVRMNIKNLLDKNYYDALYENGGFVVPGNRFSAIVTTELKF